MKKNVAYYARVLAIIGYVILIPFNLFMGYMAYAFSRKVAFIILAALSIIICLFAIYVLLRRTSAYRSGISSKNYEVISETIIMIITASVPMLMIIGMFFFMFEIDTFLYLCLLFVLPGIIIKDNIPLIKTMIQKRRVQ